MKKSRGIFAILIAILALGVGYAAISAVTLVINGSGTISPDDSNFNVHYTGTPTVTKSADGITVNAAVDTSNNKKGTFSITGMTKKDDTVTITYTVINESKDLSATLAAPSVATNSNNTYFSISSATAGNTLTANGGTTTQTVTVTALKTPTEADETSNFVINLVASPNNS